MAGAMIGRFRRIVNLRVDTEWTSEERNLALKQNLTCSSLLELLPDVAAGLLHNQSSLDKLLRNTADALTFAIGIGRDAFERALLRVDTAWPPLTIDSFVHSTANAPEANIVASSVTSGDLLECARGEAALTVKCRLSLFSLLLIHPLGKHHILANLLLNVLQPQRRNDRLLEFIIQFGA